MARVFAVMVQILLSITCVAVQTISKPEICQGAGFILRAVARVRVHEPLQSCLGSRSKSKNRDKQLTHIVRVMLRCTFIVMMQQSRGLRSCPDMKEFNYWMSALSNFLVFINP